MTTNRETPKPEKKPKRVWIIMFHGFEGWKPTMDFHAVWRTKRAALSKIKSVGRMGYKVFPYVKESTHDH